MTAHPYRIHHRGRKAVYAATLLLALAAGAGAAAGPWAVVVAAILAYGALFGGWCAIGWRVLRWHGVPDLNGRWIVEADSRRFAVVTIRQGWTSLLVAGERDGPPFASRLAGFVRDRAGLLCLVECADGAGVASILRLRPASDGWQGTWGDAHGAQRAVIAYRAPPAAPTERP